MEDMEDGCYVGLWADCSLVASQLAVLFVYPHYWRDCPTSVTGCSQFCWSKQAPHTTVIHLVWPGGVLVGPAQWPGMICQRLLGAVTDHCTTRDIRLLAILLAYIKGKKR